MKKETSGGAAAAVGTIDAVFDAQSKALEGDARLAALTNRGWDSAQAIKMISTIDADAAAKFKEDYARRFREGQIDGAYLAGQTKAANSENPPRHEYGVSMSNPVASSLDRLWSILDAKFQTDMRYGWTPTKINSTLCGHLIVGWLMIINLLGFVMAGGSSHPFAQIHATVFGLAAGILAMVFARESEVDNRLHSLRVACYLASVICTVASAGAALSWALKL